MANLPISQLPLSTSGQPDSLMVIVNYDVVPSGETNSIYFSSLTQQFSGTSGSSGSSGTSGSSGSSGTSGSSGSSGTSPTLPVSLNYGLFTQTGDSTPISATTVETSLINGGIGTLTVPANGFSAGDTFRAVFGGVLNVGNNQTLRLRVKSGSVILSDSGVQTITNITNDIWYLNIDFTVRKIGGPGTASIVSLGSFHYTKTNNGTVEGFSFNTINNTTFDTTSSNTLDVTVQWGSNNASNLIYSDVVVLNKVF